MYNDKTNGDNKIVSYQYTLSIISEIVEGTLVEKRRYIGTSLYNFLSFQNNLYIV